MVHKSDSCGLRIIYFRPTCVCVCVCVCVCTCNTRARDVEGRKISSDASGENQLAHRWFLSFVKGRVHARVPFSSSFSTTALNDFSVYILSSVYKHAGVRKYRYSIHKEMKRETDIHKLASARGRSYSSDPLKRFLSIFFL